MLEYNPRITCKDGFNISVQCHDGSYCDRDRFGYPVTVECGFPSSKPKTKELLEFAEHFGDSDYTTTVYGWVPVEIVQAELDAHGGIVEGEMPQ